MAKIAIIGGGISGLYASFLLEPKHDVSLYEASARLGGHADTHWLDHDGQTVAVDSGFIVFNRPNYPHFSRFIDALNVPVKASDMSFAVRDEATGMEYCASSRWQSLFARKRNAISGQFYCMLRDIKRFYAHAEHDLSGISDTLTLAEYIDQAAYSRAFKDWHLLPMAAALWSASYEQIQHYPMRYLLTFMNNHGMLSLRQRPQWFTIDGGSQTYVQAFQRQSQANIRLSDPVHRVMTNGSGLSVASHHGSADYDVVLFACHSDQALAMLPQASNEQRRILGSIRYQENEVLLHSDTSVMPKRRAAWGSWTVRLNADFQQRCTVSYYMNRLQGLKGRDYIVSLNQSEHIQEALIHQRRNYAHPVYDPAMVAAQNQWQQLCSKGCYFAGAYWGWGFHEDGARSAVRAVDVIERDYAC
jgi:predicted NAD/FAD-binding protein